MSEKGRATAQQWSDGLPIFWRAKPENSAPQILIKGMKKG
jgi:hypothetical protein